MEEVTMPSTGTAFSSMVRGSAIQVAKERFAAAYVQAAPVYIDL
jgi:hypothetical protein